MMIRKLSLAAIVIFSATSVASAADLAPRNPYLADSIYPLPHGDPAQQDALNVAGPVDVSRALRPEEIEYVHTGPAVFGAFSSGRYPDGKRVYWVNSLDRIVKLDYDTHRPLATKMIEGVPVWTEQMADESIADFDDNNTGLLAIVTAFSEAQKLRDLASVYTLVDNNNEYYIAYKAGYIEVYGDAVADDRGSAIELKRTFQYPEELTNQAAMGLNMTYDGWVVTVTENGKLLAVKPDFSEYRLGDLQHNEGAAERHQTTAGTAIAAGIAGVIPSAPSPTLVNPITNTATHQHTHAHTHNPYITHAAMHTIWIGLADPAASSTTESRPHQSGSTAIGLAHPRGGPPIVLTVLAELQKPVMSNRQQHRIRFGSASSIDQ